MITYPLLIPGSPGSFDAQQYPPVTVPPGPSRANLKKYDPIAEHIGEFDGSAQEQQWQNNWWELDLEWPEMTWAQYAQLDAFSGALKGKLGSFVWSPPLAAGSQGLGLLAGTPTATGADAAGSNLLHTNSWLPNQSGILLPGDFFGIPPNSLAIAVCETADGFASLEGYGELPPWLAAGATVWTSGTGICDGGPFTVLGCINLEPGWIITYAFASGNTPIYAYQGTLGEAQGAAGLLPRLYQYINPNPLNSDGGGNATLDIFPNVREAPIAGALLQLVNPQGTFRLVDNRREAPAKATKTLTFQMKCREAI